MVDIRPNALPDAILPLRTGDELIVDQGTDGVRKVDPFALTDSTAPIATQAEAVAGADNTKRMTPLRTKQSIASEVGVTLASSVQGTKADSAVQSVNGKTGNSVTLVKGDVGLGNVDNTSDVNKPISTATQAALDLKANSSVTISAGAGLDGGGNLAANRIVSLNAASIASLAKADSAVQSVNGVLPVSGNVTVAAEEKRLQDTRTTAIAESFPSNVQFVETAGYSSVGDGGGALYKRVSTEPSHAGKFQSADGAWWELRPDVSDSRIVVPNTPADAIDASKIKLDLRADFSSAVVRILSDKFRDLVSARDFGALGVSNDDTAALQAFLNQVKPTGLKAWVPKGDYGVSATLVLNNQGISGETPGVPLGKNGIYKRTAIVGDGSGSTVFRLVGDINGLHIQTGLGKAHHRGFSIIQASATDRFGVGLLVDQSQALKFSDIEVKGCFNGITNRDSFSMNYDSIDLSENINGFVGENVTSGSHPNAINFNSVRFMDNTGRGCYLTNPTTCNFFGGSFEGNGSGNAINGGLEVVGASNEGAFGINVIGTYFENNFGGFDIRISNVGSGSRIVEHRIKGCTFNRISSTRFTTHNIRIERVTSGFQKVIASENSFQGFNTYVPDAGRKYIVNLDSGAGSASTLVAIDNLYGSPLETP